MSDSTNSDAREQATLRILGFFFLTMGGLVLLATLWTLENIPALITNIVAAIVFTAIGFGMLVISGKMKRTSNSNSD